MHIPPYHKRSSWQRFFVGAFIGGVIAYFIFVYMHGHMFERLLAENRDLESKVSKLESQNEALLQDKEDLDEKSKEPITVEEIEINIINQEKLRLDRLTTHDLEELIKEEINHIIGQNITIISESDRLLKASIENKDFPIGDFTYNFTVSTLTIWKTVKIEVEAEISN